MRFWSFLVEAFHLVIREPKLFLPKLFVTALYGFLILKTARFALKALPLTVKTLTPIGLMAVQAVLTQAIFLFLATLVVFIIDVWISSWYPVLVLEYRKKKVVSFSNAIHQSWKRLSVVFPVLIGFELLIAVLLALFLNASWFFLPASIFPLVLAFGLILVFFVMVASYPLLSVSVLEKKSVLQTIWRSFLLSKQHWKIFSVASLIQFSVSLLNVLLAFLAEQPSFLVLFWVLRIVLALTVTYNRVVNPSAYFQAIK